MRSTAGVTQATCELSRPLMETEIAARLARSLGLFASVLQDASKKQGSVLAPQQ